MTLFDYFLTIHQFLHFTFDYITLNSFIKNLSTLIWKQASEKQKCIGYVSIGVGVFMINKELKRFLIILCSFLGHLCSSSPLNFFTFQGRKTSFASKLTNTCHVVIKQAMKYIPSLHKRKSSQTALNFSSTCVPHKYSSMKLCQHFHVFSSAIFPAVDLSVFLTVECSLYG